MSVYARRHEKTTPKGGLFLELYNLCMLYSDLILNVAAVTIALIALIISCRTNKRAEDRYNAFIHERQAPKWQIVKSDRFRYTLINNDVHALHDVKLNIPEAVTSHQSFHFEKIEAKASIEFSTRFHNRSKNQNVTITWTDGNPAKVIRSWTTALPS